MANNYYHAFTAHFSFVVLLIFMAVVVAAYLIGRKSVRLVPRKSIRKTADIANVPKYDKAKARTLTKMYKKAASRAEYDNTAVIRFRSNTFDVMVALVGTILFCWAFLSEHYVGLVQWCINHLAASDSAAWGDITALIIVAVITQVVFGITYAIVRLGQIHQAKVYANEFVAEKVRPIFNERRSLSYFVTAIVFCIKEEIKERQAKAEAKKEIHEIRNANIA